MNKQTNSADCSAERNDQKSAMIQNFTEFSTSIREVLPSATGQVRRHTRITSRRFTKSNALGVSQIHSPNVAGMNFSAVITTRSWSGPGVDNLICDLNAHGVSGFDSLNIAPSNGVTPNWIDDIDSLVTNFNAWAMQNQVETVSNQATNTSDQERITEGATEDGLHHHHQNTAVHNGSSNDTGFAAKNFRVGHDSILAQGALNV